MTNEELAAKIKEELDEMRDELPDGFRYMVEEACKRLIPNPNWQPPEKKTK